MTQDEKQRFEYEVMVRLQATLRVPFQFRTHFRDPPDLTGRCGHSQTAIEVVQIVADDVARGEREQRRVLQECKQKSESRGLAGCEVRIDFDASRLRKLNCSHLVEQILSLVIDHRDKFRHDACVDGHLVRLFRAAKDDDLCRFVLEECGAIVNESFEQKLRELISAKEKDIERYRVIHDEAWLVVVADFENESGYFSFPDTVDPPTFITTFDALFFFERFLDKVTVLKRPPSFSCLGDSPS